MNLQLRLRSLWNDVTSSLWFRPTVFTVIGAILAVISLLLDQYADFGSLPFLNPGVDDARAILSSITSSMLTVTSVTFSIIMVALVLASQQFSPRILRNFMRDSASQNVLGIFIGTFFFSLLVLGRVTDTKQTIFVPTISLLVSILLSTLSVGALIFFIHHIAEHIQVTNIVASIAHRTIGLLDGRFPNMIGASPEAAAAEPDLPESEPAPVRTRESGYLQAIDTDRLLEIAVEHNIIIRLERAIGDFIPLNSVIAAVWPAEAVSDDLKDVFHQAYEMGSERTLFEDILFGLRQLVDIAVKALSPGVNDPTTAGNCIDRLMDILVRAAGRPDPAIFRYDQHHALRVIVRGATFDEMVDMAFLQIRQYGASDVAVTLRMLEALYEIALATEEAPRRKNLWRHAGMICRAAKQHIEEPFDRVAINTRVRLLAEVVNQVPGSLLLPVDHTIVQEYS